MLALPAAACDDDKVPLVACGVCFRQRRLEPAGHAFHAAHERPTLEAKRRPNDRASKGRDASDDEAEADATWRKKRKEGGEKRSALKLSSHLAGADLYALLEVNESASADQIKKQYRKLALQYHPDKHGGADAGSAAATSEKGGLSDKDMHFVKIQEAYEILADQSKRRQYDSSLDVDDSLPEQIDEALGFYKTFAPAFRRNSRWSARIPVPDLGDEKTDINRVHKFYNFWFDFDSWRDFSMHDEYNLDEAEFREERRWMDRQNQKVRKKYQEAERKRILKLVETADRLDPRLRAEREERESKKREEKEKRARAKQEQEDAKLREEEERKRQAEREQAERDEKERVEREERKQSKQVAKGLRQRLKKCVQSRCSLSTAELEEVQEFCLSLEADVLGKLCEQLEASKDVATALREELRNWRERAVQEAEEQARQRQEVRRRAEEKSSEAREAAISAAGAAPWTAQEMGLLAKGLQKFPGGMAGRWGLIAQLLSSSGFHRTEQEVVAKTKELSDGHSLKSMGARLSAENSFQTPKAKAASAKAGTEKQAATDKPPLGSDTSTKAPVAATGTATAATSAEWTPDQQKALEVALQKHPASLDKNERWRLIAEDVPGKTKAQCVERFKFLREQLSKQKAG